MRNGGFSEDSKESTSGSKLTYTKQADFYIFTVAVRCLLTTKIIKIDSSRAVVTRKLKTVQFGEKCIFPHIS